MHRTSAVVLGFFGLLFLGSAGFLYSQHEQGTGPAICSVAILGVLSIIAGFVQMVGK